MTQSYYKCSFFEQNLENKKNFSVFQDEIILENFLNDGKVTFKKETIQYLCFYEEKIKFSGDNPIAIITIKDNDVLLKFTLENLKKFNVFKYVDFIIVDDRSTNDIKATCSEYPVNYLRIDNKKGFNFSMLNNIAAKLCYEYGAENIILWNSDLWVPNEQTIPNLLKLHKDNDSTITGTRLLYPTFSWNNKEVSDNIVSHFPSKKDSYRGTIQFGGSVFSFNTNLSTYFPSHFCRFKERDFYLSKVDKLEQFVTGAFHLINLKWFLQTGGLNPSMAKVFQDVDLCLKAVADDKKVFYFGKENYLFHDESVSLNEKKIDDQFKSDHILYAKIWNYQKFTKEIQKIG